MFAPPKATPAELRRQQRISPPRGNAEIAAKFQGGIRTFENRRPSPKNYLRRKSRSVTISPPKRKASPVVQPDRKATKIFDTNNAEKEKLRNELFSNKTSPSRSPGRKLVSSSSAAASASVGAAGENAFGCNVDDRLSESSSNTKLTLEEEEDLFFSSTGFEPETVSSPSVLHGEKKPSESPKLPAADHFFALKKSSRRSTSRDNPNLCLNPFYMRDEVSPLWIATRAKIVETQQVEEMIRCRLEQLEIEQLKLLFKFQQDLVL